MAQEDLASKVLNSIFFKSATKKANKYAMGSLALLELLREVLSKAKEVADKENKGVGQVLTDKLTTLSRMVKAYVSGQYRIVPWPTILKIVAVLIYFVSPLDVIPDILPIIGLTDDLAIVLWLFRALQEDIENFEAWERNQLFQDLNRE
ncbi:MAG: YkvA family protein [Flectobacillus sp.]|uniref:YkvA family protein n=1 Tax=Flectobacillus sp. TaxID=50419 RepID=UPI003B9BED48|eukprot:comp27905_c0_seq1/m.62903 comp27905_c0_seq1/g.62903  ORF comp27905_c0_seq1/g.62903 comp27905_c0_seq1/m.62903 type:complete len:149 (-) comp27905_c0_seq1:561-1007(-)